MKSISSRRVATIFALLSLTGLAASAAAQQPERPPGLVFKVIGADGRVSYVDAPGIPKGAKPALVSGRRSDRDGFDASKTQYPPDTPPSPDAPKAAKADVLPAPQTDAPDNDRALAQIRALQDAQDQLAKHQCEVARQNLSSLNRGRVARYSADGQRHMLTDGEIAAEKERAQSAIREKCATP